MASSLGSFDQEGSPQCGTSVASLQAFSRAIRASSARWTESVPHCGALYPHCGSVSISSPQCGESWIEPIPHCGDGSPTTVPGVGFQGFSQSGIANIDGGRSKSLGRNATNTCGSSMHQNRCNTQAPANSRRRRQRKQLAPELAPDGEGRGGNRRDGRALS